MAGQIVDAVERLFEGGDRMFGESQRDRSVRPVQEFFDRVERFVDAPGPTARLGIADIATRFDRLFEGGAEPRFENRVVGSHARRGEIEAAHQRLVTLGSFEDDRDERIDTQRLQIGVNTRQWIFGHRHIPTCGVSGERGRHHVLAEAQTFSGRALAVATDLMTGAGERHPIGLAAFDDGCDLATPCR